MGVLWRPQSLPLWFNNRNHFSFSPMLPPYLTCVGSPPFAPAGDQAAAPHEHGPPSSSPPARQPPSPPPSSSPHLLTAPAGLTGIPGKQLANLAGVTARPRTSTPSPTLATGICADASAATLPQSTVDAIAALVLGAIEASICLFDLAVPASKCYW